MFLNARLHAVLLVIWGISGFVAVVGLFMGDEQIIALGLFFSLVCGIGNKVFKVSEGGGSWGLGFSSFKEAFGGKATVFLFIISLIIIVLALAGQVASNP